MNTLPEWWLTASGLFFILGSIAMIVLVGLLAVLVKVALDLRVTLQRLSARVEALTDKLDTVADQVKTVTTEVGVRTSGITRMVDDAAANSMGVIEKVAPLLLGLGIVIRIVGMFRGKK